MRCRSQGPMSSSNDFLEEDDRTRHVVRPARSGARATGRHPCLLFVHGEKAGDLYRISRSETLIGRGAQSDLVLADDGVSRAHAKLLLHGDGRVELVDLGSTNGTYVEGRPITSCVLSEGDAIGIGILEVFRFGNYAEHEAQLQHQLYTTATHDGLTGTLNRRHLMVRLRQEVELARRSGLPLGVVMFDVDHFKRVNDEHGHAAGDDVLRGLAERIRPALRTYDLFGRYGGEEFVMVLPQTEQEDALAIAERLRLLISGSPFPRSGDVAHRALGVTASLGLAVLDVDTLTSPERLLQAADEALYRAKAGGRNRVCLHGRDG